MTTMDTHNGKCATDGGVLRSLAGEGDEGLVMVNTPYFIIISQDLPGSVYLRAHIRGAVPVVTMRWRFQRRWQKQLLLLDCLLEEII
jgi:hypothetical protein